MSKYTTGELARLCGVTVRTVQYYDTRNILVPSKLSEGGRRLYSDGDLRRLRIICFLREAGISIQGIETLLHDEHPEKVIGVLLDEEESALRAELGEARKKLGRIGELRRGLKDSERFSVESIGDIATVMTNKKNLKEIRRTTLWVGLPLLILQIGSIALWIAAGIWLPFLLWFVLSIPTALLMSRYYFRRVAYLCPECHGAFQPRIRDAFFANHTPRLRRLTCPNCGQKSWCVETAKEAGKNG